MKTNDTTNAITLGASDAHASGNNKSFRVLSTAADKSYYVILCTGASCDTKMIGGTNSTISGSTNLRDGLWHHVVFTVDQDPIEPHPGSDLHKLRRVERDRQSECRLITFEPFFHLISQVV